MNEPDADLVQVTYEDIRVLVRKLDAFREENKNLRAVIAVREQRICELLDKYEPIKEAELND